MLLTDSEIDAVIRAEPAAVYELRSSDATPAAVRESLRLIARNIEREAYRRAAAACRQVGNTGDWAFIAAHHCANAVLALGRKE